MRVSKCGAGRAAVFCLTPNVSCCPKRTIDGDGNALVESVAVGTDEGGDLGKRVDLLVVLAGSLEVDVDGLNVEVVGLRDSQDGRGAGVRLLSRIC